MTRDDRVLKMVIPPFTVKGVAGARLYCLAFVPVRCFEMNEPKIPATYGLYFCGQKRFGHFSFRTYADNGDLHSYCALNEDDDTLESVLLFACLGMRGFIEVPPAMWRLFPRQNIPSRFRSPAYVRSRRQLCKLLFTFRWYETTKRVTADLPKRSKKPFMIFDKSVKRLGVEDTPEDSEEFEEAILWRKRGNKKARSP